MKDFLARCSTIEPSARPCAVELLAHPFMDKADAAAFFADMPWSGLFKDGGKAGNCEVGIDSWLTKGRGVEEAGNGASS